MAIDAHPGIGYDDTAVETPSASRHVIRSVPAFEDDRRTLPCPKAAAIEARYGVIGARTVVKRLREEGALRLRQPSGPSCQGILVNTAGGIVGGDRLSLAFTLEPRSDVTITSASAEKVYRVGDAAGASAVEARFSLAPRSRLVWIPQETILFDAARLQRRFVADLDATSELVVSELLVFGRKEYGEHEIAGHLRDSWRVRRDGRLVFADEALLDGAIGRLLARGAVASGCHTAALLLFASPRAASCLEAARAAVAAAIEARGAASTAAGAVTLKDGIIVARLLAPSSERLRAIVVATLLAIGVVIPRVWQ